MTFTDKDDSGARGAAQLDHAGASVSRPPAPTTSASRAWDWVRVLAKAQQRAEERRQQIARGERPRLRR